MKLNKLICPICDSDQICTDIDGRKDNNKCYGRCLVCEHCGELLLRKKDEYLCNVCTVCKGNDPNCVACHETYINFIPAL
jgi:hypothetical protein